MMQGAWPASLMQRILVIALFPVQYPPVKIRAVRLVI